MHRSVLPPALAAASLVLMLQRHIAAGQRCPPDAMPLALCALRRSVFSYAGFDA